MNNINNKIETNLIGQDTHRSFLEIQASIGIAQRGGVTFTNVSTRHQKRLVSDINVLNANEIRKVIFSEAIFNN